MDFVSEIRAIGARVKALVTGYAQAVETAIAKATAPLEAEINSLKADLADAEADLAKLLGPAPAAAEAAEAEKAPVGDDETLAQQLAAQPA